LTLARSTSALIGLVVGVAVFGRAPALAGTEDAARSPEGKAHPGPRDLVVPASAVEAQTFEALRDLVADPAGPAEIVLSPGTYRGDLVVKRPVAIRGRRGAVLEGTGAGTVVTIEAKDVTLDNVVVRRSGRKHTAEDAGIKAGGERVKISHVRVEETLFGIALQECRSCLVESAYVTGYEDDTELRGDGIKLWESNDSIVRGCEVDRARDVVVWYTKRALLEDNVVKRSRYGSHFMYAHDAKVRRSRFEGNVVGIFVMYSARLHIEDNLMAGARGAAGVGLGFKDSDAVDMRGNWLIANTAGVYLDNTPRTPADPVNMTGNLIALNDVALRMHSSGAGQHFKGNDFRNNAALVEVDGGGDALAVEVKGNHFSDYEGYDLDGNGVGDVPHEVKMLSSALTEAHPSLKLFHGTAAMGVIDAVAHAVPVFASKKLLVDAAPLVRSPELKLP
jgi:nitrous oxidase accessory protein